MSSLIIVRNPFDRGDRRALALPADAQKTVAALVGEYIPAGVGVNVSINGHRLRREAWAGTDLAPGDQMVVVPQVCGDDFNPLSAILMIAVVAAAPYAAAALMGTSVAAATGGFGFTLLSAGISMVGSMVVGALTAPAKPTLPGVSSFDASPAYSWTPATTQEPGAPIARAYGRVKLYGNIIGGYIENTGDSGRQQTAHLLIDLGMGPYAALSDFKINDQPVSSYNGIELVERLGLLAQSAIPAFNDTRDTYVIGAKVVAGSPVTRDTVGTDFGALEIVLALPQGLWYANDQGGLDAYAADLKVEISTDAGASWKVAATSAATSTVTSSGYWSAGYYSDAGGPVEEGLHLTWTEVEAGSSTRTDHTEGETHAPVSGYAMRVYWRWLATPVTRTVSTNDHLQLSAASTQPIRKTIRVDGIAPGTACKVRVTNLNADQTSSRYGDDVYFAELNEVLLDDFTYPRTVLVAVKAIATDQLSGSMRFSCVADAALVWYKSGGVWYYGWSRNPAWVCYDVLTQPVTNDAGTAVLRYDGLDPSRIDVDSFVAWAAFCSVVVPDGKGGSEARCEYDGVFDTATDMWAAALDVAATARATLIMRGTQIAAVYDDVRPAPAQMFTVANSRDFSDGFLPLEGRASVIEAEFNDRDLDYGRNRASVINDAVAAASGVVPPASKAFRGVVRASQVWRELNTMLARNQYLQRTGELAVDIDSLAATAGDRVDLQVDVTRWGEGGRALAGTTSQVTLDHPVTLAAGVNEIMVRLSDPASDAIETRTITTGAGTVSVVDVTPAFSHAVRQYDVWAIGAVGASTKPFLITAIARDSERRAKLSLIEYNASLYGLDGGIPAQQTPNISASVGFGNVIDLVVSEQQVPALDGTSQTQVTLHFGFDDRSRVRAVLAYAQPVGAGPQTQTLRTLGDSAKFVNLQDGVTYLFTLVTENYLGQSQPFGSGTAIYYDVVGRGATVQGPGAAGAPPAPTGLTAAAAGLYAIGLDWTCSIGTRRDIGYTEVWASTTNDRATAARIDSEPWPSLAYKHIGLASGTPWYYWIRLVDTAGNAGDWYPAGATAGVSGTPEGIDTTITAGDITDALTAAGLEPVSIVSSLPSPIGYAGPKMLFVTADGKLYRYAGGAFSADVTAVDLISNLDLSAQTVFVQGSNCTLTGNTVTSAGGSGWDASVYSKEGWVGGAFASAVPAQDNVRFMFGLNTDPTTDESYGSIDFAMYCVDDATLQVYESGSYQGAIGSYTPGDVLAVTYDGKQIQYLQNGVVLRTVVVAVAAPLFFDSSIYPGGTFRNLRFGPMSSVANISADQILANAITTPKLAVGAITAASGILADAAVGTAKIIDANVTTLKVAGAAITAPQSAYTAAATLLASIGTFYTVQTISITATGEPVFLIGRCVLSGYPGDYYELRIYEDGTQIAFAYVPAGSVYGYANGIVTSLSTPAAGTRVYTLQATCWTSTNTSAEARLMFKMETKR